MLRIRPLALCLLMLPFFGRAPAAVVVHEYALQGTLDDNRGGPALTALGGNITALGYVFAANQGLTLVSTALSATDFSIEFSFNFSSTSGYRKIADFHALGDDSGFYQLNGALNFYPIATAPTTDFLPNTDVHVVLTRDGATQVVTGYVNGQQRFTFLDSGPTATFTAPNHVLTMFVDDFATSQGEASGGRANFIRVYNGALTGGQVSALFAAGPPVAVPEPSAAILMILGAIAVVAWPVSRRRKSAA